MAACVESPASEPAVTDPRLAALAGSYVRGWHMTWTETLTIEPDGRFERSSRGCATSTRYSGTVTLDGDRMVLHGLPDDPATAREVEEFDYNELHVVTWGERVYLVEEFVMEDFCQAINAGLEPRPDEYGNVLLRSGDWLDTTTDLPNVPPRWAPTLLRVPVEATIVEVVDEGGWIDRGAADGLQPGMRLILHDVPTPQEFIDLGAPSTRNPPLEIVEVDVNRCLVIRIDGMSQLDMEVGMRVTSRAVDHP